ncbi:MAG: class I SAM-dependent methyltransferase [Pseudomonadota bacterium]
MVMNHVSRGDARATGPLLLVASARFLSWRLSLEREGFAQSTLTRRYAAAASKWSAITSACGAEAVYADALTRIARSHGLTGRRKVRALDCGVGAGATLRALALAFGPDARLAGVDAAAEMVSEARAALFEAGMEADLRRADIRALPFPDEAFDICVSAHCLEHLAEPETGLREMARTIKPGGLLIAILTPRSMVGAWVHLKWRVRLATDRSAGAMFAAAGLPKPERFAVGGTWLNRALSVAYVARKPAPSLQIGAQASSSQAASGSSNSRQISALTRA